MDCNILMNYQSPTLSLCFIHQNGYLSGSNPQRLLFGRAKLLETEIITIIEAMMWLGDVQKCSKTDASFKYLTAMRERRCSTAALLRIGS
jgi:hypothetical protein